MPDTNYTVQFKQASGDVGVIVSRNSTTQPVDATSGAPNRLKVPHVMDFGSGLTSTTISAASNATPIVLTVGSITGFANGDLAIVEGVLGNLNANGTFFISSVAGSNITLDGSAGSGVYTSGGRIKKLNKAKSYHIALATALAAILNDKSNGN